MSNYNNVRLFPFPASQTPGQSPWRAKVQGPGSEVLALTLPCLPVLSGKPHFPLGFTSIPVIPKLHSDLSPEFETLPLCRPYISNLSCSKLNIYLPLLPNQNVPFFLVSISANATITSLVLQPRNRDVMLIQVHICKVLMIIPPWNN